MVNSFKNEGHDKNRIYSNGINAKSPPIKATNQSPIYQKIDLGDNQLKLIGFQKNVIKTYITQSLYVVSLGLVRLFFHWYPQIELFATHSKCSLDVAEKVLIVDTYKRKFKSYFVKCIKILKPEELSERIHGHIDTYGTTRSQLNTKNQYLKVQLGKNGIEKEFLHVRTLNCKKLTYIWDPDENKFVQLVGLEIGKSRSEFHQYIGYSSKEQHLRRVIYGLNEINVPVQSILTLFFLEALTPFYIFQVFSILVWLAEEYYYYGIAIVTMSAYGITSSIIETRRNQKNLKGTVSSGGTITICRPHNVFEDVKVTDLVPGDVISISSEGYEMQCDAVLLLGSLVVNESMLTGESVPVTKSALPKDDHCYNVKEDSSHTLFSGTKILQVKQNDNCAIAVVIRTGYLTTKGELVRSILYPPPADFKFDQDSYKFMGILAVIAACSVINTIVSKSSRQIGAWDVVIKSLDSLTIAIPTVLPATMTIGKLYALGRLKSNKIYCINSRVINVAGSVNCVCFDKTGTLTEDELDMWGVHPVEKGIAKDPIRDLTSLSSTVSLFKGMLTCHSLNIINGNLCGYPLDLKIFESTGWNLKELPNAKVSAKYNALQRVEKDENSENETIDILKQYPFSSNLQRSSVIIRDVSQSTLEVFCKGSPEIIMTLSNPDTIPINLTETLKSYTAKGYRVIAIGNKEVFNVPPDQINSLPREQVECDLNFCGLVILENRLKKQTTNEIKCLKDANMKLVMITGDNLETAVSVGKDCGIINKKHNIIELTVTKSTEYTPSKCHYQLLNQSFTNNLNEILEDSEMNFEKTYHTTELGKKEYQLVATGNSWKNLVEHFPHFVPRIVLKGVVFARMSSHEKQQLIEELKNLGYYVGMCGDGANDCAALKAAHLGISLSDTEASIASPFSSKEANISCVSKIIKEGRAALTTSFGAFKFMICYSMAEFTSMNIMYGIDDNMTPFEYLFIDIFLALNFAAFFGKTKAYDLLDKTPPLTSLLKFIPLVSMTACIVQVVFFQLVAFYFVQTCSWFVPYEHNPENPVLKSYENYSVFIVSMFQYIGMAVLFSKGKPYRKPIYTNHIFMFSIISTTCLCCYITIYPAEWLATLLELQTPPDFSTRLNFLIIALINFLSFYFIEEVFIDIVLSKYLYPKIQRMRSPKKGYLKTEKDFGNALPIEAVAIKKGNGFNDIKYETYQNEAYQKSEEEEEEE